MKTNRSLLSVSLSVLAGIGQAFAQQGTPLLGNNIPQFVDPLPSLNTVVDRCGEISLRMCEFKANVMPSTFTPEIGTYDGTTVWGYIPNGPCPTTTQNTYLGPLIVATRGDPTRIRFINELPPTASSNLLAWKYSTDQTLHWADPLNNRANMCSHMATPGQSPEPMCAMNYEGPVPTVIHLHGGEIPPEVDGNPESWFTSTGLRGPGYFSLRGAAANEAIYTYPNSQQAAPLWFHDHTLGITRLNVYAGLAGGYLLIDPQNPPPANLRQPADIIPLVIQDRMFDTNGQLFFPTEAINPDHPFWNPEFLGDVIAVNGKVWPYKEVEPKRYRFLVINGSNARTYEMFLVNPTTNILGPSMYQIGTEGGYLDRPVLIDPNNAAGLNRLLLMPGERVDIIIDFAGFAPGTTLVLRNTAPAPFDMGDDVDENTTGVVMQFRITCPAGRCPKKDKSYNPALNQPLRTPMVRLVDPAQGTLAKNVQADRIRQLTLNEVLEEPLDPFEGGPRELLVNNTKWEGSDRPDFKPVTVNGVTLFYSERPREGDTEVWEIVNLTVDAHPIHLHLVQVQLINRQDFDVTNYLKVYETSFPGGSYIPGFGPPLDYRPFQNLLSGGKEGGNPDVSSFLSGPIEPPQENEWGWKDTVRVMPGQVSRIAVRWAPTDLPALTPHAHYPFDPSGLFGYVWHCHIMDHEDNEMMRPIGVKPLKGVKRDFELNDGCRIRACRRNPKKH